MNLRQHNPWQLKDLLLYIPLFLGVQALVTGVLTLTIIILYATLHPEGAREYLHTIFNTPTFTPGLAALVMPLAIYTCTLLPNGTWNPKAYLLKATPLWKTLQWILGLFVALFTFELLLDLFQEYLGWTLPGLVYDSEEHIGAIGAYSLDEIIVLFISGTILAPIGEEILFRGFMFHGLVKYVHPITSAVLSSLLFAFVHGYQSAFLIYFIMGMSVCWLTWKYESIVPAIGLHILNNIIAFTMMFILL